MHHSDPDVIVVWKLAGHLDPLQNVLDLVTAEIDAIPIEFRGAALDVVSSSVQHIQIADAMVVQVTNHRVVEYVRHQRSRVRPCLPVSPTSPPVETN